MKKKTLWVLLPTTLGSFHFYKNYGELLFINSCVITHYVGFFSFLLLNSHKSASYLYVITHYVGFFSFLHNRNMVDKFEK